MIINYLVLNLNFGAVRSNSTIDENTTNSSSLKDTENDSQQRNLLTTVAVLINGKHLMI